ncbi:ABC transporter permease [Desulfovulcanus sp.]
MSLLLSLKIALSSLRNYKLRAVLAVLGIFLGSLAFTGVQHISKALVRKAELETEKLGPNLFMVVSGTLRFHRSGRTTISRQAHNFTLTDVQALANGLPGVLNYTPFIRQTMPIKFKQNKITCQIVAAWPNYPKVRSFWPEIGRFFDTRELEQRAKVCVLGAKIAQRLFGSKEKALGKDVFFFRAACRVIGVMEEKGSDITGTDQDEQVFVPLTTYMRRFANQSWVSGVYFSLSKGTDQNVIKEDVTTIMRLRHRINSGEQDDFSALTARDTIRLQKQALDLVKTLGLISSSISFAVGGIGVLSIMILLVRMRRLEIGVRRAMGARKKDIVQQFLFEAATLSTIGGLLGVSLSLVLVYLVTILGEFPFVFDPEVFLGTLLGSMLLGIGSGAYPAWLASKVEVLTVLRGDL